MRKFALSALISTPFLVLLAVCTTQAQSSPGNTSGDNAPIKVAIPKSKKAKRVKDSAVAAAPPVVSPIQQAVPRSQSPIVETKPVAADSVPLRDNSQSERYHQAAAQTFELTPAASLVSSTVRIHNSDIQSNTAGIPFLITGEYGISSFFSIAVNFGYTAGTTSYTHCPADSICNSTSAYGVPDPQINLKFKIPVGSNLVRFGVNSHIAIEKAVVKSSSDQNVATGGSGASPFVALEMPLGSGLLGAEVEYEAYAAERKRDIKGAADTISGGAQFATSVYYELNYGIMTYGAALSYATSDTTKTVSDGATTYNSDSFNNFAIQLYAPVHFKNAVTLFPTVGYAILTFPASSAISGANAFQIGASGRFAF